MTPAQSPHGPLAETRTLPDPLRLLHVGHLPVTGQVRSIIPWLTANQPSPQLWRSLLANGYALQLEEMMPSCRRPIPFRRITSASGGKADMLL